MLVIRKLINISFQRPLLLSICINVTLLGSSYKWSHNTFVLSKLHILLSMMSSGFTNAVALRLSHLALNLYILIHPVTSLQGPLGNAVPL